MDDVQVRRLVVPDSDKRMCGIVSLADAARGSHMAANTARKG
jgi:predicted transcriptional regulator